MTVLIVGADRIGAFVSKLEKIGVQEVIHWNCRSQKVTGYDIPLRAEFVIFCTDFLHHTAARTLKKKIKERGVPAIYCRRAWSEIEPAVSKFLESGKGDKQRRVCCRRCRKSCSHKKGLH